MFGMRSVLGCLAPRAALGRFSQRSLTTISASPAATSIKADIKSSAPTTTLNPELPYIVYRSNSQLLPVYTLKKRGGNMLLTKVRKIDGDVKSLRNDLKAYLEIENDEHITINPVTQNIIIKGHRHIEVKKFLEEKKF